jgi:hypothetical protein
VTVVQFFRLGLKPKLSLGVRSARVGFKPILKKVRGFVAARCEPTFVDSKSILGLGAISYPGTVWNSGSGPGVVGPGFGSGHRFSSSFFGYFCGFLSGCSEVYSR